MTRLANYRSLLETAENKVKMVRRNVPPGVGLSFGVISIDDSSGLVWFVPAKKSTDGRYQLTDLDLHLLKKWLEDNA